MRPSRTRAPWPRRLLLLALISGTARERFALLVLSVVVALPTVVAAAEWNRYGGFCKALHHADLACRAAATSLVRSKRRFFRASRWHALRPLVALASPSIYRARIGSRPLLSARPAVSITGHWQPPLGGPMLTAIETICVCWLAWIALRCKANGAHATSAAPKGGAAIDASTGVTSRHHERQRNLNCCRRDLPCLTRPER